MEKQMTPTRMIKRNPFDALQIGQLQRQLNHQQTALEMVGVVFCVHCGKPHLLKNEGADRTFTRIKKEGDDVAMGLVVCMDDPVSATCFLQMINKCEEDVVGQLVRVRYSNLELDFAKWVLDTRAYLPSSPYNGFVQSIMAGESIIEPEHLPFHLAYWSTALCGDDVSSDVRKLIAVCGLELDDEEYDALILRCLEFATRNKHAGQIAFFSPGKKLKVKMPDGIFSGLMK